MRVRHVLAMGFCLVLALAGISSATSVDLAISGKGAVDDSTIKAGEPVNVDVYIENDTLYTGFSLGFKIQSPSIKNIKHVADSGKGLNKAGDIKGFNGWQDHSIWNFGGVYTVERDWDGKLPELVGFGGLSVQQEYEPHKREKVLSFEVIVPDTGYITVDSAFFPPGGRWLFATPTPGLSHEPDWDGPYTFKVIK